MSGRSPRPSTGARVRMTSPTCSTKPGVFRNLLLGSVSAAAVVPEGEVETSSDRQ